MDKIGEMYIGVMSGTSLDGVDVVLCWIDNSGCRVLSAEQYPFDAELKDDILKLIDAKISLAEVGVIDHKLGLLFGGAINTFIEEKKIDRSNISAIGLHGQTLWHEPDTQYPFSMQLGDANIVTSMTDITVVADFRRKDIANGGQGAPFAPAFHKYIFSGLEKNVAVLNIGGMANITILGETIRGCDTGCGNVLMDYWISKHKALPFDKNGDWARSGEVNQVLLEEMLRDEYFLKEAPKSTGRELFNPQWLQKHLCKFPVLKSEDVQATLLELTLVSIANEIKNTPTQVLIVCGGGAKNSYLMQKLEEKLQHITIKKSNDFSINSDFLEAMAFAWLAYKRIHNEVVELCSVTGAKKDSILGAIYA